MSHIDWLRENTKVMFFIFTQRKSFAGWTVCICVFLVDPSQGVLGPPGPEGAEGKPGTQVPILYHILIPSPVHALFLSLCHLHPVLMSLWIFFCNFKNLFHTHVITILFLAPILSKTGGETPHLLPFKMLLWIQEYKVTHTICTDWWFRQQEAVFVQYSSTVQSCKWNRLHAGSLFHVFITVL